MPGLVLAARLADSLDPSPSGVEPNSKAGPCYLHFCDLKTVVVTVCGNNFWQSCHALRRAAGVSRLMELSSDVEKHWRALARTAAPSAGSRRPLARISRRTRVTAVLAKEMTHDRAQRAACAELAIEEGFVDL